MKAKQGRKAQVTEENAKFSHRKKLKKPADFLETALAAIKHNNNGHNDETFTKATSV